MMLSAQNRPGRQSVGAVCVKNGWRRMEMNEFYMDIAGIKVRVQRKKVKCIRLYIKPPDGSVYISMPQRCSLASVREFVESKRDWIEEKQEQCRSKSVQNASSQQSDKVAMVWGRRLELVVESCSGRESAEAVEGKVVVRAKNPDDTDRLTELLDGMYRRLLLNELPQIAEKWQQRMGVKAEEWRTRRMKTRWGTCNVTQKRIWLNLRLAMLPRECLEYVVVHELCHLHEHSHNQRFKALMFRFMPEWAEIRKRMNESSGVLY